MSVIDDWGGFENERFINNDYISIDLFGET